MSFVHIQNSDEAKSFQIYKTKPANYFICENLEGYFRCQIAAIQASSFGGDIIYLRLADGSFCYPACSLQDKFARQIVGWKVAARMTAQLVSDVFNQMLRRGLIGKNAFIYSDEVRSNIADCFTSADFVNQYRAND